MLVLAVLGLGGCLCAWAQDSGSPFAVGMNGHPGSAPRRTSESTTELRVLSTQLALTPEQKEKLRPIVIEKGEQLSTVRLDEHITLEQRLAKSAAIREAFRPKIEAVLTPEQLEKWKKLEQQGQAPAPTSAAPNATPAKQQ
jgi:Spy/CpxP family protein refolding chaperone